MLKFFWRNHQSDPSFDDPLDHPVIRAMSLDEIADLPMTPDWPYGAQDVSSLPSAGQGRRVVWPMAVAGARAGFS